MSESKNNKLNKARKAKNDEFFTQITDIENELQYYAEHLKDKTIYCNCDNPLTSNFFKYFYDNFEKLQLKRLIASHYVEQVDDLFDDVKNVKATYYDSLNGCIKELKGDGDFRSKECLNLLKQADIVITNPPFSLFSEFIKLVSDYNKKYVLIGHLTSITLKNVFNLIKTGNLFLGVTTLRGFFENDLRILVKIPNVRWFTNIEHGVKPKELVLTKEYKECEYKKYDNYDAINVDKTVDIPKDYYKVVGVPISFLDKYNPEQFEILECSAYSSKEHYGSGALFINGSKIYAIILIKLRQCGSVFM